MRILLHRSYLMAMILCIGIVCMVATACAESNQAGYISIEILSVNDFHGALAETGRNPGIAKLAAFLKAESAQNSDSTIIVSAGDMFQGTPDSNLLHGRPVMNAMNESGFAAMTLGNHEFDWGQDMLKDLLSQAKFPVIAANILDKATGKPVSFVKPYVIIERSGLNIALIGLATPETAFKTNPKYIKDYIFADPVITTQKLIPELRQKGADIIIVLSHLGSSTDAATAQIKGEAAELAWRTTGVDAIISGHTHWQVAGSVNSVPIVQAGYNGRAVGKIVLEVAHHSRRVVAANARVIDLADYDIAADPAVAAIVGKAQIEVAPVKQIALGRAGRELSHDRATFSLLGQWVTDIMRRTAAADIAFQNGGGLRANIPSGVVTMGKMYEVLPFDNTLVTLELTGEQVLRVLEYGLYNQQFGMLQYSGLMVKYNKSLPAGEKIAAVTLANGEKLNLKKTYRVVTNDFMAQGGDGFTMFSQGTYITDTQLPLRECLIESIKSTKTLQVTPDNRLTEITVGNEAEKPAA